MEGVRRPFLTVSMNRPDLALDPGQLLLSQLMGRRALGRRPIQLAVVFGHELLHEVRLHEMGLEATQHAGLDHLAAHGSRLV
jgi:hypothetical protein